MDDKEELKEYVAALIELCAAIKQERRRLRDTWLLLAFNAIAFPIHCLNLWATDYSWWYAMFASLHATFLILQIMLLRRVKARLRPMLVLKKELPIIRYLALKGLIDKAWHHIEQADAAFYAATKGSRLIKESEPPEESWKE